MATIEPSTRRRKANGRGDRTRDAILRAAQQHFADRGYRGASLASIAETAGISEPGLLHHFPSKRALLLAVLAQRDLQDEQLFQMILGRPDISVVEGGAAIVAHNQSEPESVRLFSVLLGESLEVDHPAHEHFSVRYRGARRYMVENLRAELADQAPPDVDLDLLAPALLAVMDGLQYQWLLDDSIDMVASYQALARIVLRALGLEQGPHGERPPAEVLWSAVRPPAG